MECAIIAEGFCKSVAMYGVKYAVVIGDGDCSVHKKILELNPYPNIQVEKIECTNHLLRNFCTKVKRLSDNTAYKDFAGRKQIGSKIRDMRAAIEGAVKHRIEEKGADGKKLPKPQRISNLMRDIQNMPHHIYGDHTKCASYFCKGPKPGQTNLVPSLKKSKLFEQLEKHVIYIANKSRSLIENVTSNIVEQLFSKVAKYVGGKRVNVAQTYDARCSAAVISHNTGGKLHYITHKKLCGISPGEFAKKGEARVAAKVELARTKREEKLAAGKPAYKPRKIFKIHGPVTYRDDPMVPPLSREEFEKEKNSFLAALKKTREQRTALEQRTRLLEFVDEWMEERKKIATASNFGAICKRMPHTSCNKLVRTMIYSEGFSTSATEYGKNHEPDAREALSRILGLAIEKCGLQIDEVIPYIGATTDGRVVKPDNGIVELKCHESAAKMTPEEAVKKRISTFWKYDKKSDTIGAVNTNDNYYYQVQGQLHVTQATHCYFAIWTPVAPFIKYERIERDDTFWKDRMEPQITNFYLNCLLPEMIEPQCPWGLPAKDPPYIIAAIAEKAKRDGAKAAKKTPTKRKSIPNKKPATWKRPRKNTIETSSDSCESEGDAPGLSDLEPLSD